MPLLREKKISVCYKEPEVTKDELKMIFNFWLKDVPIAQMFRRLQPARCAKHIQPLIYVDLYSILFLMLTEGVIQQRRSNPHEMTIKDFAAFFRVWKQGGSERECLSAMTERPEALTHAKQVFRSTCDRYRREQAALTPGKLSSGNNSALALKQHVLSLASRRKVDNRQALVIFIDEIPIGMLAQLKSLKDVGLNFDLSLLSGDQVLEKINQHAPKHTPPVTPSDIDLEALDPTGDIESNGEARVLEAVEQQDSNRRLRPRKSDALPPPEAADEEPEELLPDDSVEKLLEHSNLDLSLENLADDDPL